MDQDQARQLAMMLDIQCAKCANDDKQRPDDPENLTVWGQCLMELCMFKSGEPTADLITLAVQKLEKAAELRPNSPAILAPLAQALNMTGFNSPDRETANRYFKLSVEKMREVVDLEPDNIEYKKTLENLMRAPEVHEQLLRSLESAAGGKGLLGQAPSGKSQSEAAKKKRRSELKYSILGYVVLALGLVFIFRRASAPASSA
eukprot:CAMPEP_0184656192 /NCGR_PEP_ID=MMETSP0308-20130426/15932_1 /TAXON_ID=38269 /ORGANISM="Gloeochaete witrockiana, Strain SAG 46.84" /LENGTH=202 /DNA_ID=CAMNT_0027093189 /DNA_START=71 /DNA_END=679 /DNA_ORIENTATION=+